MFDRSKHPFPCLCSSLVILLCSGFVLVLRRGLFILNLSVDVVATIKYLVKFLGWNGIALQAVHSCDAKIYIDDPGPWIWGLATRGPAQYAGTSQGTRLRSVSCHRAYL
jgi:hypothetical protein